MTGQDGNVRATDDKVGRLRSGEVASAAGINVQTLRYYERRGLLAAPDRDGSGHRQFPAYTVTLLQMIKNAQRLGFSLDEISDVVAADDDADVISQIAVRKVAEIDRETRRLATIRDVLAGYVHPTRLEHDDPAPHAKERSLDFKLA